MVSNDKSICQNCGSKLKRYDKVSRIVRTKGGKTSWIEIERFRCPVCGQIHRELPDYIFPYVLNVRTWAGTNNPLIKSWPRLGYGNLVDVCDVVNAADGSRWYYIRIDGRIYGFVHSAYIEKV